MDTKNPPSTDDLAIGERAKGTWTPVGKPTTIKAFRIEQEQFDKLAEKPYKKNSSLLIRMLLKLYFNDKIPSAKMQFQRLLNETQLSVKEENENAI